MGTFHKPRRLGAYGIGLVHGMGGSAGVSVLILASIESKAMAVLSLVIFALFTAVSMTVATAGYGATLASRPVRSAFDTVAPILGAFSLAFGMGTQRQRGVSRRTPSEPRAEV